MSAWLLNIIYLFILGIILYFFKKQAGNSYKKSGKLISFKSISMIVVFVIVSSVVVFSYFMIKILIIENPDF